MANKVLSKVLAGTADANINFEDLRRLLLGLGFTERVRGPGVEEILNLQPHGASAKPYQVRQVRNAIVRYKLALETE